MKRKFKLLLPILLVAVLLGTGAVLASEKINQLFIPKEKADEYIKEQLRIHNKSGDNDSINLAVEESFYESLYFNATKEQKEKLDLIIADKSIDLPGEWKRDALIAVNKLSADTPRITLDDAEQLIKKVAKSEQLEADLTRAFNEISGAPDWEGGSGIHRAIYFINDERTEAIYIMLNGAFHIVHSESGDDIVNIIGSQEPPVKPEPTKESDLGIHSNSDNLIKPESTSVPTLIDK